MIGWVLFAVLILLSCLYVSEELDDVTIVNYQPLHQITVDKFGLVDPLLHLLMLVCWNWGPQFCNGKFDANQTATTWNFFFFHRKLSKMVFADDNSKQETSLLDPRRYRGVTTFKKNQD